MEIIIKSSVEEAGKEAAAIFKQQVIRKPDSVLGLATGSSPLGLYRTLINMHRAEGLDFSRVVVFNLDEYVGLGPEHPQSYAYYMRKNLFDHINVAPQNIHIPDGLAQDIPAHCIQYEREIASVGGIDLQLLGLGSDGHIGFNEPSSSLSSRTRLKTLAARTIEDNARFFDSPSKVPRHVITMGVGTIMESRHCLVLATGANKATAVAAMVEGAVMADVPASILQMHPKCTLVIDEEATAQLKRADYYRWVYENKPAWQRV